MRTNRILALLALLGLIVVLGYGLKLAVTPKPMRIQGQIEAQEYNVSSKVPGRVEKLLVRKGDKVEIGDLLFSIASPELDAKLLQAQGGRDAAKAMQSQADNGARSQQIMVAKEQWQKAKAAASLAKTTYNRVENLFQDGVLARQKRDEAYTQWQAAKFTEQAADAMHQMAKEGARSETKAAAKGQAMRAEGAVREVSAILEDSQIRAFKAGEISEALLHPGELAPSGFPVVSMLDMADVWAIIQAREDQLKYFKQGEELSLEVPALGQSYQFKVSYISVMGDFANWRATEAGHDFDMRTFEVELRPVVPIADLRVGMSVLITL